MGPDLVTGPKSLLVLLAIMKIMIVYSGNEY
jgi:hypothetical protein